MLIRQYRANHPTDIGQPKEIQDDQEICRILFHGRLFFRVDGWRIPIPGWRSSAQSGLVVFHDRCRKTAGDASNRKLIRFRRFAAPIVPRASRCIPKFTGVDRKVGSGELSGSGRQAQLAGVHRVRCCMLAEVKPAPCFLFDFFQRTETANGRLSAKPTPLRRGGERVASPIAAMIEKSCRPDKADRPAPPGRRQFDSPSA